MPSFLVLFEDRNAWQPMVLTNILIDFIETTYTKNETETRGNIETMHAQGASHLV